MGFQEREDVESDENKWSLGLGLGEEGEEKEEDPRSEVSSSVRIEREGRKDMESDLWREDDQMREYVRCGYPRRRRLAAE